MVIKKAQEVPFDESLHLEGVKKQILIGPQDGSEEIIMRQFTVQPGSQTPYHHHGFPHLVKIETGKGAALDKEKNEHPVQAGDLVYVHDDEIHGFKNTGEATFQFICIVPRRGEK